MSWKDVFQDVVAFCKAMQVIGVNERKAVNIMGHNAPEWVISFYGAVCYNAVCSGIYITNTPEACLYQAEHSEAEVLVVDSIENLKKFEVNLHKLPNIKAIVVYSLDKFPADVKDTRYYLWSDFLKLGSSSSVPDSLIQQKMFSQKPGHCCTLIYTSGTTGNPKGVMLSHDNLIWNGHAQINEMKKGMDIFDTDRVVSYLPLSHIAGLQFDVLNPMLIGG